MLIIATSVALVTIPITIGIYSYAQQKLLARETAELTIETEQQVTITTQKLKEYELSLQSLSIKLAKQLANPAQVNEEAIFGAQFDTLIEQNADLAWRSNRQYYNGQSEAGLFIPPSTTLTAAQKNQFLQIKHVLDIFSSAISSPNGNIWLLTTNKAEIIFDRRYPNFVFEMAADTDYTKTPWVTLGDPNSNPTRSLKWTPPLFDPVSKVWMVSAIMPVDVHGQWIGNLGRDLSFKNTISALFQFTHHYNGELNFLLDSQGNYIQAGPWQNELEHKPENFKPEFFKKLGKEPQLAKLLKQTLTSNSQAFEQKISFEGRQYLAIGTELSAIGWRYFRLIPEDEVLAPMRKIFYTMLAMMLATGLLIGGLIDFIVERQIVSRIKVLANTLRNYSHGALDARSNLTGSDEIAHVSRELDAMASQLKSTLDTLPDILFDLGLDGRYYAVHTPDERLLAAPPRELIGKTVSQMLPQQSATVIMAALREANEKGWSRGMVYQRKSPLGLLWFELSVAKKANLDNQTQQFIVLSRNITERKKVENDLRISAIAFEAQESMMVSDANRVILRVNKAFTDITGYSAEEVVGQPAQPLRSNLHDEAFYQAMWDAVNEHGTWKGEIYSMRKNGEVYPGILSITTVRGADHAITNYVTTMVDISREKTTAEEIQFLAFYDPLTNLANRRLLLDRLNHALITSTRSGKDGALLFLDLDHFKSLNDTLGHDMGDLLLKEVAKRLTDCVREDDTVARLGGDEFVVLLENLSEKPLEAAAQTEAIGTKILTALNQPYQLGLHEHHSTPSIGIALFSDHQQSQDDLLKHADIAMYQAKKSGRNTLCFFDPEMQQAIHARVDLERELRKAVEKQQVKLYYQVQINKHGHAIGAEGLIRWLHPQRGLIPPLDFIPLAEETGLILPIGEWVLQTACAQIQAWQHNVLTQNIALSVNVSAKQFRQADFTAQVQSAVQRYDINPAKLKLELTESILLEDFDGTIATMNALKEIGVLFTLDDFGTGYSSLQYLKRLPLSQLKIDQSFVQDILTDSSDKAIVRTIIAMAKSLDLDVIAEGVETAEQQQLLTKFGCESFQGYLFSKPVPVDQFEALLNRIAAN